MQVKPQAAPLNAHAKVVYVLLNNDIMVIRSRGHHNHYNSWMRNYLSPNKDFNGAIFPFKMYADMCGKI